MLHTFLIFYFLLMNYDIIQAAKGGELKEMWDKMTAWNASGDPVFSLDGAAHYEVCWI